MAKNETKSKAELYREERKARIAKANKKNAKGIETGRKAASIIRKVVAVALVAAIVCGIGYYIVDNTGIDKKIATAVKVGDTKVSAAEFSYYYNLAYQSEYQNAYYASYYGYTASYDINTAPDEQYTTDEDGNQITYAEYFRQSAIDTCQYFEALYAEAMDAGFKLSDEEVTEINDEIEELRTTAAESDLSLDAYLALAYDAGLNEKSFKKILTKTSIVSAYAEQKKTELSDAITDEEIEEEYNADTTKYDYIDVTYYVFTGTTLVAEEDESDDDLAKRQKAQNKEFFAEVKKVKEKIKDADSFEAAVKEYEEAKAAETATETTTDETTTTDTTTETESEEEVVYTTTSEHTDYSTLSSAVGEKAADDAYDEKTKDGDIKYIEDEDGNNAYIVLVNKAAYNSNSVSVRHCLVMFEENEDGSETTDEQKKEAKEKAEDLLDEWVKAGDTSEESFETLCVENSEDTGVTENNGLYADIRITDGYVESFLDWSFDSSREAGDYGIIESEYGYHIMYFVSDNTDDMDYAATIRSNKADEAYTAYEESLTGEETKYPVTSSDFWTNRVSEQFCDKMRTNLASSSSSSSY